MRIERTEVLTLHMTYPGGRGFRYAGGVVTGRVSTLVRITTDTGLTGGVLLPLHVAAFRFRRI